MKTPFSMSLAIALLALLFTPRLWAAQIPTGVIQDKAHATTNPNDYAPLPIGFHWRILDKHHAEIYFDKPGTYKDFNYLVSTASNFSTYNALLVNYSAGVVRAINDWALDKQQLLFTIKCSNTSCTGKLNYKRVCAQKTCTLPDSFANLTLTGSTNLNGSGNANDNILKGNSAANTLNGFVGNDKLKGGGGKDTLIDQTGNNTLQGESGDDSLTAGPGDDVLSGGDGKDTLFGGLGNDQFKFSTELNAETNLDRIADFSPGSDQIFLKASIFRIPHQYMGRNLGTITESFRLETGPGQKRATTPQTRLIYDTDSGTVYYDADGSGSAEPIKFVILENLPVIAITDFALF